MDRLECKERIVESTRRVFEPFSDLIQPSNFNLVGGEEKTEEEGAAKDGSVSREDCLQELEQVIEFINGPVGGIQVLNQLRKLVHLELDVLGDVDEGVVEDLVKVCFGLDSAIVLGLNLVPLLVFHRLGLAATRLVLVL